MHRGVRAGLVILVGTGLLTAGQAWACFACGGDTGDFTVLGVVTWQLQGLHGMLISAMQDAQKSLASGRVDAALIWVLTLSLGYGALHALAPGHAKAVMGLHAVAGGARLRDYALASLLSSLGHVLTAVIIVALVLTVFQGMLSDADTMRRTLMIVAGLGVIVAGASLALTGSPDVLPHAHGTHGHEGAGHTHHHSRRASVSLFAIAGASALVPCTSSILVLIFGASHQFWTLSLIVVLFIALGQAATQFATAGLGLGARHMMGGWLGHAAWQTVTLIAGGIIVILGVAILHSALT